MASKATSMQPAAAARGVHDNLMADSLESEFDFAVEVARNIPCPTSIAKSTTTQVDKSSQSSSSVSSTSECEEIRKVAPLKLKLDKFKAITNDVHKKIQLQKKLTNSNLATEVKQRDKNIGLFDSFQLEVQQVESTKHSHRQTTALSSSVSPTRVCNTQHLVHKESRNDPTDDVVCVRSFSGNAQLASDLNSVAKKGKGPSKLSPISANDSKHTCTGANRVRCDCDKSQPLQVPERLLKRLNRTNGVSALSLTGYCRCECNFSKLGREKLVIPLLRCTDINNFAVSTSAFNHQPVPALQAMAPARPTSVKVSAPRNDIRKPAVKRQRPSFDELLNMPDKLINVPAKVRKQSHSLGTVLPPQRTKSVSMSAERVTVSEDTITATRESGTVQHDSMDSRSGEESDSNAASSTSAEHTSVSGDVMSEDVTMNNSAVESTEDTSDNVTIVTKDVNMINEDGAGEESSLPTSTVRSNCMDSSINEDIVASPVIVNESDTSSPVKAVTTNLRVSIDLNRLGNEGCIADFLQVARDCFSKPQGVSTPCSESSHLHEQSISVIDSELTSVVCERSPTIDTSGLVSQDEMEVLCQDSVDCADVSAIAAGTCSVSDFAAEVEVNAVRAADVGAAAIAAIYNSAQRKKRGRKKKICVTDDSTGTAAAETDFSSRDTEKFELSQLSEKDNVFAAYAVRKQHVVARRRSASSKRGGRRSMSLDMDVFTTADSASVVTEISPSSHRRLSGKKGRKSVGALEQQVASQDGDVTRSNLSLSARVCSRGSACLPVERHKCLRVVVFNLPFGGTVHLQPTVCLDDIGGIDVKVDNKSESSHTKGGGETMVHTNDNRFDIIAVDEDASIFAASAVRIPGAAWPGKVRKSVSAKKVSCTDRTVKKQSECDQVCAVKLSVSPSPEVRSPTAQDPLLPTQSELQSPPPLTEAHLIDNDASQPDDKKPCATMQEELPDSCVMTVPAVTDDGSEGCLNEQFKLAALRDVVPDSREGPLEQQETLSTALPASSASHAQVAVAEVATDLAATAIELDTVNAVAEVNMTDAALQSPVVESSHDEVDQVLTEAMDTAVSLPDKPASVCNEHSNVSFESDKNDDLQQPIDGGCDLKRPISEERDLELSVKEKNNDLNQPMNNACNLNEPIECSVSEESTIAIESGVKSDTMQPIDSKNNAPCDSLQPIGKVDAFVDGNDKGCSYSITTTNADVTSESCKEHVMITNEIGPIVESCLTNNETAAATAITSEERQNNKCTVSPDREQSLGHTADVAPTLDSGGQVDVASAEAAADSSGVSVDAIKPQNPVTGSTSDACAKEVAIVTVQAPDAADDNEVIVTAEDVTEADVIQLPDLLPLSSPEASLAVIVVKRVSDVKLSERSRSPTHRTSSRAESVESGEICSSDEEDEHSEQPSASKVRQTSQSRSRSRGRNSSRSSLSSSDGDSSDSRSTSASGVLTKKTRVSPLPASQPSDAAMTRVVCVAVADTLQASSTADGIKSPSPEDMSIDSNDCFDDADRVSARAVRSPVHTTCDTVEILLAPTSPVEHQPILLETKATVTIPSSSVAATCSSVDTSSQGQGQAVSDDRDAAVSGSGETKARFWKLQQLRYNKKSFASGFSDAAQSPEAGVTGMQPLLKDSETSGVQQSIEGLVTMDMSVANRSVSTDEDHSFVDNLLEEKQRTGTKTPSHDSRLSDGSRSRSRSRRSSRSNSRHSSRSNSRHSSRSNSQRSSRSNSRHSSRSNSQHSSRSNSRHSSRSNSRHSSRSNSRRSRRSNSRTRSSRSSSRRSRSRSRSSRKRGSRSSNTPSNSRSRSRRYSRSSSRSRSRSSRYSSKSRSSRSSRSRSSHSKDYRKSRGGAKSTKVAKVATKVVEDDSKQDKEVSREDDNNSDDVGCSIANREELRMLRITFNCRDGEESSLSPSKPSVSTENVRQRKESESGPKSERSPDERKLKGRGSVSSKNRSDTESSRSRERHSSNSSERGSQQIGSDRPSNNRKERNVKTKASDKFSQAGVKRAPRSRRSDSSRLSLDSYKYSQQREHDVHLTSPPPHYAQRSERQTSVADVYRESRQRTYSREDRNGRAIDDREPHPYEAATRIRRYSYRRGDDGRNNEGKVDSWYDTNRPRRQLSDSYGHESRKRKWSEGSGGGLSRMRNSEGDPLHSRYSSIDERRRDSEVSGSYVTEGKRRRHLLHDERLPDEGGFADDFEPRRYDDNTFWKPRYRGRGRLPVFSGADRRVMPMSSPFSRGKLSGFGRGASFGSNQARGRGYFGSNSAIRARGKGFLPRGRSTLGGSFRGSSSTRPLRRSTLPTRARRDTDSAGKQIWESIATHQKVDKMYEGKRKLTAIAKPGHPLQPARSRRTPLNDRQREGLHSPQDEGSKRESDKPAAAADTRNDASDSDTLTDDEDDVPNATPDSEKQKLPATEAAETFQDVDEALNSDCLSDNDGEAEQVKVTEGHRVAKPRVTKGSVDRSVSSTGTRRSAESMERRNEDHHRRHDSSARRDRRGGDVSRAHRDAYDENRSRSERHGNYDRRDWRPHHRDFENDREFDYKHPSGGHHGSFTLHHRPFGPPHFARDSAPDRNRGGFRGGFGRGFTPAHRGRNSDDRFRGGSYRGRSSGGRGYFRGNRGRW